MRPSLAIYPDVVGTPNISIIDELKAACLLEDVRHGAVSISEAINICPISELEAATLICILDTLMIRLKLNPRPTFSVDLRYSAAVPSPSASIHSYSLRSFSRLLSQYGQSLLPAPNN